MRDAVGRPTIMLVAGHAARVAEQGFHSFVGAGRNDSISNRLRHNRGIVQVFLFT
jgi:hypothetical protein